MNSDMIPWLLLVMTIAAYSAIGVVIRVVVDWDDDSTECNRKHFKCDKRKVQR